mmetsp:Transcript_8766/g.10214  ORF Transcript_8766/g.10214 Transcript_8766/m.10214 type:complete len:92 (+) Transcript_8766:29-304(+)
MRALYKMKMIRSGIGTSVSNVLYLSTTSQQASGLAPGPSSLYQTFHNGSVQNLIKRNGEKKIGAEGSHPIRRASEFANGENSTREVLFGVA